jgi:hypothetical protein
MFKFLLLLLAVSLQEPDDFEALMGKQTSHWKHVVESPDRDMLSFAGALYEKNKMAQYTQQGKYKIPPVVHFIWLGPRPFPPESVENVRDWMDKNPGWTVKFWTDRDRAPPYDGMEKMLVEGFHFLKLGTAFEQSQNWGEKSDLLRYEILYQEGGVYVDHDASCLRSFDGMHRGYDFFCGLETPHEPFVGRSVTCGNAVIGASSHHPTMGKVIDLIDERWDALGEKYQGKDDYSRIEVVMQRTYIALTDAVLQTIGAESNNDIIFPAAYFLAKSGIHPLYCRHLFSSAWIDSKTRKTSEERTKEQALGKIRQKNRNVTFLLVGLFAFNGLVLCYALVKRRRT